MTTEQNNNNAAENKEQQQQEAQEKTTYAVRPHHHYKYKRLDYSDPTNLKVRNKLNTAFILLVIVGITLWYTMDTHTPAYVVLLVGVVVKIAEVCIRLFRK